MKAIDLMVEEHNLIVRMLKIIRKLCLKILNENTVSIEDFNTCIDFIKNYADSHHHNKEELILFKIMGDALGERIKNGPIMGMLVEHDLGRLYVVNLERAIVNFNNGNEESKLDIIANAIGYTDLLQRHIDKENSTIYSFAERSLSKEKMDELNEKCFQLENSPDGIKLQQKYKNVVKNLEKKLASS